MPETETKPLAVRATAFIRPSRWLQRPVRLVRYDAYWADGRVDFDVSQSRVERGAEPVWRLGLGIAGLGLGAFLTIGPISDGPAGFVGVLCWIFGLGALAGLIRGNTGLGESRFFAKLQQSIYYV